MFGRFFGRNFALRAKSKRSRSPSEPQESRFEAASNVEDGSENATRRQLVQVLLRDLLRKSGIPSTWIECQLLPVASSTRGHGMYVRLVLRHWDERLLRYAVAFQKTLLSDIERFEPHSTLWLHGLSWQLEMDAQCPLQTLPPRAFWQEPAWPLDEALAGVPTPAGARAATRFANDVPKPEFGVSTGDFAGRPPEYTASVKKDVDEARFDIERLFAVRDREMRMAFEDTSNQGFEATQPMHLPL
jgi:hypothetical protein